ncbi:MAG: GIY-YIG nuclease family protein [Altibacter sp.]|uniref:GIY-YIG nuclease family protein n=1 Tax=Altibacter sp. TaxID=2024823 RepID=UPI001D6C74C1|nr:GIY-YIG nuclease family protein [Altibacter sp.]
MYFVYIIESERDGTYYIGQSDNLEKRLELHNNGFSKYTSRKLPWKLVYYESYPSRKESIVRERFLKQQRNREFYKRLIENKE